jgi:hypothetical protein
MLHVLALWVGLMAPAAGGDARLLLTVDPADSTVLVDGKELRGFKSGTAVPAKPGNFIITVEHAGYGSEKREVKLVKGETTRVSIKLDKKEAKPAPVAKGDAPAPKPKADAPAPKPTVTPRPTAKPGPSVRPNVGGKPTVKPKPESGPIVGAPTNKPVAKPKADDDKPTVKPKPKDDDDKPAFKPKPKDDDDKPTVKPKPKDDQPPPSRPRPVHKPHGDARPVASPQPAGGTGADYPPDNSRTSLKPYAALSFVIGGLALTGGVVAGVYANKSADEFNHERRLDVKQDLKTQTEQRALASNVLYGVGATGMLVGALLWAMDPGDGGHAEVSPLPEGGAMVGWGGTF